MRADSVGMFWQDLPTGRGRANRLRVMPAIPETGWRPPTSYPNLSTARVLSIDLECCDPNLEAHGPGWARGDGYICGFSIGTDDGYKWYFPIRHTIEAEMNLNPEHSLAWLRHTLRDPNQPKVGANLLYDIGWLNHEGIEVAGELVDVQFAEALLTERAHVDLETLGEKYLNEGKRSSVLYKWCADYYGGKADDKQRANIYRAPPRLVGPYGEGDADLPIRLAPILYEKLRQEGLVDLFRMECGLINLLVEMRRQGVTVDVAKAEEVRENLLKRGEEEHKKLDSYAGQHVEVNAATSIARAFDRFGLKYPRTEGTPKAPNGKPSFTKDFLENLGHPLADMITDIRRLEKLRGTFVEGYILNGNHHGKIYCSFHPLRGQEGGARSGRFSSSHPNLQNIPVRDPELGKLIRSLFIPDPGMKGWRKYDYSQIELRFLMHYATGPGADAARQRYNRDPKTDYHNLTQDLIKEQTGQLLDRRPVKTINFGIVFGMGEAKLGRSLDLESGAAKRLLEAYHKGLPFVRPTMTACMEEAARTGLITTILGRRSRFDLWEPATYGETGIALPYEHALYRYGHIKRAYVHKALNRRLQGSAADLIKVAMWKCWNEGVFRETGVPRLQVHDELDFNDPGGRDNAFDYMKHILETAIPILIPIRADYKLAANWGLAEG